MTEVQGRIASVTAVVVTYNRKKLLGECLDGLLQQTIPVRRIILIDNASTDGTPEYLAEKGYLAHDKLQYVRQAVNSGGAGGFHEGVKRAYAAKDEWLWMMDDDVEPLPEALATLLSYSNASKCIHGAQVYPNGNRMEWERCNRIKASGSRASSTDPFDADAMPVKVGCFEGMLIHRDIVSKIGLPDPRFFVGIDDVVYGYQASKHTQPLYTRKVCFKKKIDKEAAGSVLDRLLYRLQNRRSRMFYSLIVRNEWLLYAYMREVIEPARFYVRIALWLLWYSVVTLLCERSVTNFRALWHGAISGWKLHNAFGRRGAATELAG